MLSSIRTLLREMGKSISDDIAAAEIRERLWGKPSSHTPQGNVEDAFLEWVKNENPSNMERQAIRQAIDELTEGEKKRIGQRHSNKNIITLLKLPKGERRIPASLMEQITEWLSITKNKIISSVNSNPDARKLAQEFVSAAQKRKVRRKKLQDLKEQKKRQFLILIVEGLTAMTYLILLPFWSQKIIVFLVLIVLGYAVYRLNTHITTHKDYKGGSNELGKNTACNQTACK